MQTATKSQIAPFAPKIWYNFSPPYLMYQVENALYKIEPDGNTFLVVPGCDAPFPIPGCPIADKLMWANFQFFLHRYRKMWPAFLLFVALLALLQFCLWLIPDSPLSDAKINFISLLSFGMNAALIACFSCCIIAVIVYQFKGGMHLEFGIPKILPDADVLSSDISIRPDETIFSASESESKEDFKARVIEAQKNLKPGVWLVVIAFQHPSGLIVQKGPSLNEPYRSLPFPRNDPPFKTEQEKGVYFRNETWDEYVFYLQNFCFGFMEFAKKEKLKPENGDPLENYLEF